MILNKITGYQLKFSYFFPCLTSTNMLVHDALSVSVINYRNRLILGFGLYYPDMQHKNRVSATNLDF